MKTAKEVLDDYPVLKSHLYSVNKVACIEAIKEYAREACKTQRRLCAENLGDTTSVTQKTINDVINAPEPKLK